MGDMSQDMPTARSTARHDFDHFEAIARIEFASGKFRWRQRLTVVLHYNASRRKLSPQQEIMDGARQLDLNSFAVGEDD